MERQGPQIIEFVGFDADIVVERQPDEACQEGVGRKFLRPGIDLSGVRSVVTGRSVPGFFARGVFTQPLGSGMHETRNQSALFSTGASPSLARENMITRLALPHRNGAA